MSRRRKKEEPKQEWAMVPTGEYMVPLIGVPKTATQEKCTHCGAPLHLTETVLDAKGQPSCKTCTPE